MTKSEIENLKWLAEAAPTVCFGSMEKESDRFYDAASPPTILSLIAHVEKLEEKVRVYEEALERIEDLQPVNERERREIAREALKAFKGK